MYWFSVLEMKWAAGSTFAYNPDAGSREVHVFVESSSPSQTRSNSCTEVTCLWPGGHAITNPALGWITFEK